MGTRVVLTDVTVTDAKGNPIRGIKQSDFRIFDDNRPQALSSFVEHSQRATPTAVAAQPRPGTVSNAFLLHPPEPVNVVLIDTTSIPITDQM